MAATNLGTMFRGDSKTVQFTLDGTKLPAGGVSNFKFWFTAKNAVADLDANAVWQKAGVPGNLGDWTIVTAGDPSTNPATNAVVNVAILPADTTSFPDYAQTVSWDFQVEDASGNVTTAAQGTLTVNPDYTRAS